MFERSEFTDFRRLWRFLANFCPALIFAAAADRFFVLRQRTRKVNSLSYFYTKTLELLYQHKIKKTMKKIITLLTFLFLQFTIVQGQDLIVEAPEAPANSTEEEFILETILNSGTTNQFIISNIEKNCSDNAFGVFSLDPNLVGGDPSEIFGLEEGVVLSTGNFIDVPGPNEGIISTGFSGPGDEDLTQWSGVSTNDACVFEFDVATIGNSFVFNYVFGSEEYDSYVCTAFNDVFALLITGPNPNGGFYDNENIALIPNTELPVAISTVNDGVSDGSGNNICELGYSEFYAGESSIIDFEGLTVTLTAQAQVIPFETYSFKIAIADGSDSILDSGVFIAGESFEAQPPIMVTQTGGYEASTQNEDGEIIPTFENENGTINKAMVEGCHNKTLQFDLGELEENCTLHLQISGSAENGVDFSDLDGNPLPSEILFTPSQSNQSFELVAIGDEVNEGTETIIVKVIGIDGITTDNEALMLTTDTIFLLDSYIPFLSANAAEEGPFSENTTVEVNAFGGETYEWFPTNLFDSPNEQTTTLTFTADETYGCTITNNGCSETIYLSLTAAVDTTDTGINTLQQTIKIYPNPVRDFLYINSQTNENKTITLFNQNGIQLLQTKEASIDFSTLDTGLYFIAIETNDGIHYQKIIKN